MAYDEGLAERIRGIVADRHDVSEKRMFGGIAFMIRGHMSIGIVKDDLMVRVGPEALDNLVRRPHARPMDFTGRPLKGFVFVSHGGYRTEKALAKWIKEAVAFASSLPQK